MKLNILAYKNKKVEFYDNVFTSKDTIENVTIATVRGLKTTTDPKVLCQLVGKEFYQVGVFDDDTGDIQPVKVKLLDFDDYIKSEEEIS